MCTFELDKLEFASSHRGLFSISEVLRKTTPVKQQFGEAEDICLDHASSELKVIRLNTQHKRQSQHAADSLT
jgi:hypothetical protein